MHPLGLHLQGTSHEELDQFRDELWLFLRTKMNELEEQSRDDETAKTYNLYSGLTGRED